MSSDTFVFLCHFNDLWSQDEYIYTFLQIIGLAFTFNFVQVKMQRTILLFHFDATSMTS